DGPSITQRTSRTPAARTRIRLPIRPHGWQSCGGRRPSPRLENSSGFLTIEVHLQKSERNRVPLTVLALSTRQRASPKINHVLTHSTFLAYAWESLTLWSLNLA